jgi:hypothetical protein
MADGGDWMQQMAEFGIEQHGGFGGDELTQSAPPGLSLRHGNPSKRKRSEIPKKIVVTRRVSPGVHRHTSRLDFVQAVACADEEELNTLMHIVINVMVRECHKDRVMGGDVEVALEKLMCNWKDFCAKCSQLKEWIRRKREDEKRRLENKEEEEMEERVRKRRRTRALLLAQGPDGNPARGGDPATGVREDLSGVGDKEYQELMSVFGSELLIDIGQTPQQVYQDTKNVRIGTILCMVSKSKALQRLACVGKFYAQSLGHEYHYVKIPKESLDEFMAFTNILRNAFMTQQTSPELFVRVVQNLVIRGGVHGCIHKILNVARKQETVRLSLSATI